MKFPKIVHGSAHSLKTIDLIFYLFGCIEGYVIIKLFVPLIDRLAEYLLAVNNFILLNRVH